MSFFSDPHRELWKNRSGSDIWTISAKWANRRHECNLTGIQTRCGGRCCSTKGYWPPSAFVEDNRKTGAKDEWVPNGAGVKNPLHACGFLGEQGCTLSGVDRPVLCLLYPFMLNSKKKLVLHSRCTTAKGVCRGNHNNGPIVFDVIRENLIALFGQRQVDRVRRDIVRGRDSHFVVPPEVKQAFERESLEYEHNLQPVPRSQRVTMNGQQKS